MAKINTQKKSLATTKETVLKTEVFIVEVLANTFVEGVFKKAGSRIEVSQEFLNRILSEKDNKFKIF